MDDEQFVTFVRLLYAKLPGMLDFVKRNSTDLQETHRSWRKTLEGCSLPECLNVIDSWLTGKRPFPTYAEQMTIALVIKACVGYDRSARERMTATRYDRDEVRPDALSIGPAALRCIEAAAEGASETELKRILDEELAKFPPTPPENQPRHNCWKCRDKGTRMVWRPDEIDRIRIGTLKPGAKLHYCGVACDCASGARFAKPHGKTTGLPVFRLGAYCEIDDDPFEFVEQSMRGQQWIA